MKRGPYDVAGELGIEVAAAVDLPFRVGSDDRRVVYRWDPMRAVREDRIWEGIAQCVLTRIGVPWSESLALGLAKVIRTESREKKAS